MKRIAGFTLVEMIIVIVIISIMLSITLNLSANQTKALRFKIARESFVANYNSFIIRAITTNSSSLSLLLQGDISALSARDPIAISGSAASSILFEDMKVLKLTQLDNQRPVTTTKTLSFDPLQGRCLFDGSPTSSIGNSLVIALGDRNSTLESCYTISLPTCKITQTPCS